MGKAAEAGHSFFAVISRMKYINRWGLMRNTRNENIQEHSLQVAMIAHALALVKNRFFGGAVDADRAAVVGMFHDCDEIVTGDMPTPIKYFSKRIRDAYREVEAAARDKLLSTLPDALRDDYRSLLTHEAGAEPDAGGAAAGEIWRIVKAADTISAHLKCLEELASGNTEFRAAAAATKKKIAAMRMPEADYFMQNFAGAFRLSLDEFGLSRGEP